ncbi:hypothetical protein D8W71_04735 [Rhodococcus sp. P1Y]|nr:hypothetical protein D8W71_04735 [Rhodococcus sp. P1Y]
MSQPIEVGSIEFGDGVDGVHAVPGIALHASILHQLGHAFSYALVGAARVETSVRATRAEGRAERDVAAGTAGMRAVMTTSARACSRPDQHGSRAESMTASAPGRRALDPSIAQSMEGCAGVLTLVGGASRCTHARHRLKLDTRLNQVGPSGTEALGRLDYRNTTSNVCSHCA